MSRPQAGDKAPAFSGLNQKGETISLDQFKGKKVALYFYPKDDTPAVRPKPVTSVTMKWNYAPKA